MSSMFVKFIDFHSTSSIISSWLCTIHLSLIALSGRAKRIADHLPAKTQT
jgi:hypothetical protein